MDIKQLKYFRTIVAEGNITLAANRLFMTQPSLSHQLKLLEHELGVKLIARGNRKLAVTEAGALLAKRAEQILELLNATALEVKELHEGCKGTLLIGTIASSGVTLLPGILREFHRQYPQVNFQLYEGDTPRILELLKTGVIEIGIIRSVFDPELYQWVELPPEPMIVAMPQERQGLAPSQPVDVSALAGKPLLVHRSNDSLLRECCRKAGFEPCIVCKGDDVRTLLVLASEGIGLAVLPKSALGLIPGNTIQYREIADAALTINKSIIWLKNRYLSAPAKHFISQCPTAAASSAALR